MASTSRTAQFTRLHKILKKYSYPLVTPDPNRPVMEHLLFATCLENAHYDVAEQAFAGLVHNFFDWNEIRVSTVRELSEVLSGLPDPPSASHRLKRILQSTFESTYSFDLEELRKQNLGTAVERLRKIDGTTKFSIAYVVQSALGGHAIPLDSGALQVLELVGLITSEESQAQEVAGLERAIPKNKGMEFGSMLHELGADFIANPYALGLQKLLLEIEPAVIDRLPKRRAKKASEKEPGTSGAAEPAAPADAIPAPCVSGQADPAIAGEPPAEAGRSKKSGASAKKDEPGQPAACKKEKEAGGEEPTSRAVARKPSATKKKPDEAKKEVPAPEAPGPADPGKQKTAAAGLSKKKPR